VRGVSEYCNGSILRCRQPLSNALQNIRIRQTAIVKARSINKNNVTATSVTMSTADGANISSARLQIVADGSVSLSSRHVDKLPYGLRDKIATSTAILTELLPAPVGPITL
jgi:hypothetical protein